jgi:hypothetical protein
MLRSIADIARFYGENLSHGNTKMACLEVFALSDTTPTAPLKPAKNLCVLLKGMLLLREFKVKIAPSSDFSSLWNS